ncbi:unnamed protein product, partial [Allacma fusca]
ITFVLIISEEDLITVKQAKFYSDRHFRRLVQAEANVDAQNRQQDIQLGAIGTANTEESSVTEEN